MNATRDPSARAARWKSGNSLRQGPHHDAHLFTTTGCPRSDAMRALNAAGPPVSRLQAWLCSEAIGAGTPASAPRGATQDPPALLALPPPAPPPAWLRPIASTAASASAPAPISR